MRYCACGELSLTSGSYWPSADVSVRSMSMPSDAGSCFISRRIGSDDRPRRRELRLQVAELGAVRQPAVPEQVADLLERRALREIVNVVAVVRKNAAIAIQITDGRSRGDDVFQAGFRLRFVYSHAGSYQHVGRRDRHADTVQADLPSRGQLYLAISGAISSSPVNCWRIDSRPV